MHDNNLPDQYPPLGPLLNDERIQNLEVIAGGKMPHYKLVTRDYLLSWQANHLLRQYGFKITAQVLNEHPTFEVSHDYKFKVTFAPKSPKNALRITTYQ